MATPAEATPLPPAPPPTPRPAGRPTAFLILMMACGAAFGASYAFGNGLDLLTLIVCGAKDRELILGAGEWWRLVSAGFLHADAVHLAANLVALYVFGRFVERFWGARRFLLIYLGALVGGNLASLAATPQVAVGASGAIFGLFGAVVVFSTFHRRFVPLGRRVGLWITLGVIAAVEVAIGYLVPFVDHAGHAGGLAAGALAALVLRPTAARPGQPGAGDAVVRALSTAAVVVAAWSLGLAAQYAWAADWILLARTEMEPRAVHGNQFTLFVPRGWVYETHGKEIPCHDFLRPGYAAVRIAVVPPRRVTSAADHASRIRADWLKEGAQVLVERPITLGPRTGIEMVFRRRTPDLVERRRELVFPTWDGSLFQVTCMCPERHYRVLEIIFDKMIQGLTLNPPQPATTDAQALWRRFIEDPRDAEACVVLAAHYAQEGRYDAAEQVLRVALGVRPDYADAHDQLAYLYATARGSARRPEEAIRHARKALALKPDTPRYLATLALAHEAAGQRAQALGAAKRAADLAPDDARYTDLVKRLSP